MAEKERLIYADELRKVIDTSLTQYLSRLVDQDDVLDAINNAPTIDAEPVRHGHWIKSKDNTFLAPCYECSICGRKINTFGVANKTAPYCHCGAKMDLEANK